MTEIHSFIQGRISSLDKQIDQVVDEFLAFKKSENTRKAYSKDIHGLIDILNLEHLRDLAQYQYADVVKVIQSYLDGLKVLEDDTSRVINARTINRKAYALSSFFKYLVDVYNYPKNPLNQFQPHAVDRRSSTQSLTRFELVDMLKLSKSKHSKSHTTHRNYICLCFLAVLALRRNELVMLKWKDIDHDQISINVYQKGGSYKLLPIPVALYNQLNVYRKLCNQECEYLFHPVRNNANGNLNKPISVNYVYEFIIKLAQKVCPDKKITPHSLRKTFIEQALDNNEDFISIINATGHATVEMVKYYDTRDTLKNNAVHNMGKLV